MNNLSCQAPTSAALYFTVSLNEEHTFLRVAWDDDGEIDLGERVHHYSLLTLARRRLSDFRRGLDPSSQGWTDAAQLSRMLGLDPAHLNIQLHRARAQLARALPDGVRLPDLVERRRGELRLGALPFRIVRGSQLEGSCAAEVVI
ncbi:hypothetical protein EV582_5453 [Duganella sp. BK701]|nr:hypothetical protein EV582_5453 [Duganella sp. BK701]